MKLYHTGSLTPARSSVNRMVSECPCKLRSENSRYGLPGPNCWLKRWKRQGEVVYVCTSFFPRFGRCSVCEDTLQPFIVNLIPFVGPYDGSGLDISEEKRHIHSIDLLHCLLERFGSSSNARFEISLSNSTATSPSHRLQHRCSNPGHQSDSCS